MKKRSRLIIALPVLLLVIAGGFLIWWFLIRQPPVPRNIIVLSGRIEADDSTVATKVSGRIRDIRVREGDTVKAGDVIALLDEEQAAAVESAKKQVNAARGNLTAARANLKNPSIRSSQAAAIQKQIKQAQTDVAAAQADSNRARAQLKETQANRSDLTVIAPFDGVVATRVAEPGEVVAPGTAIITMFDMGKIYLRGFVPEGDIGRVKLDQAARVYLDSNPKVAIDAYVSRIDPEASFTPENTYFRDERVKQVVGVKLLIKNPNGAAKPGMPADGEILVEGVTWPKDTGRR